MTNSKVKSNPKQSKMVSKGINTLNTHSSTNSLHQSFINSIKQLYTSRHIRTVNNATALIDLLKAGDTQKFYKRFLELTNHMEVKMNKSKNIREERVNKIDKEIVEIVDNLEEQIYKPTIETIDRKTKAPTSRILLKRDYKNYDDAWNAGVELLITASEKLLKKGSNVKLSIGIQFTAINTR